MTVSFIEAYSAKVLDGTRFTPGKSRIVGLLLNFGVADGTAGCFTCHAAGQLRGWVDSEGRSLTESSHPATTPQGPACGRLWSQLAASELIVLADA
jgi:hypothetical protein